MNLKRGLKFMLSVIIAVCPSRSVGWEYCKPEIHKKLCREGINHTICDPEHAFKDGVNWFSKEFVAHVPVTRKLIRVILHMHNDYRNRVAGGTEISTNSTDKYPIASRMRELIWDNELMYDSHIHTLQVRMGHDKCRNTQRYPYAGQNLGFHGAATYKNVMDVIIDGLEEMYGEKNFVTDPIGLASKYLSGADIGHFTTMSNDWNSRVGCALSLGKDCMKTGDPSRILTYCYYLGCNYDAANIKNTPVYQTDPTTPGSKCSRFEVGKSAVYENLCANSGKYFDPTQELGLAP